MAGVFVDDGVTVEHLIQEIARPLGDRDPGVSDMTRTLAVSANRRRSPRLNLVASDIVVQIDGQCVTGVDFSLRGVQFRSAIRLALGSTVMLTVRWRDDKASMALGRVMWATFEKSSKASDPHYRVGVVLEASDVRTIRAMLERCGLGRTPDVEVVQTPW